MGPAVSSRKVFIKAPEDQGFICKISQMYFSTLGIPTTLFSEGEHPKKNMIYEAINKMITLRLAP